MNILFAKIGAIGDVVMALHAVVNWRKNNNHRLIWICGSNVAQLVDCSGLADEIVTVNENRLFSSELLASAKELCCLWKKLAALSIDEVVIAHSDLRYRLLTMPFYLKRHRSFALRRRQRPLPITGRYYVAEHLRLLAGMDGNSLSELDFLRFLPGDREADIVSIKGVELSNYVMLFPGGSNNALRNDAHRRWPLEHYVQLSKELRAHGYQVVLGGAKSDEWVLDAFTGCNDVINCIGFFDLLQTVGLISKAVCVVTHDSGPMHLVTLTDTYLIALFGPTSPNSFIFSGRNNTKIMYRGNVIHCVPCYDGKYYANCKNNICLLSISSEEVFSAFMKMMER